MSIESELLTTLGSSFTRRGKTENEEAYTRRIVKSIATIDEGKWDALSNEAQAWFNEAAEAMNSNQPVPQLPKDVEEEKPTTRTALKSAEPEPEPEPEVATKPVTAKPAAPKPAAVTKPKVTQKPKVKQDQNGESATTVARRLFCTDPSLSVKDVLDSLSKAGKSTSKSTLQTLRFDVRKTIDTLKDLGMLK